ncbi:hypothetical protein SAMN05216294_3163 [Flagellimonas zhangzhouensis]|nr:hypothetical protein SAMN05216294_3163 [Allomuricauda zhangzhouensis]
MRQIVTLSNQGLILLILDLIFIIPRSYHSRNLLMC